jgi:DNA-directed RNA polymerase specialized sigma24 family protein
MPPKTILRMPAIVASTPRRAKTARTMKATGEHTAEEIGRTLGVSRATVYRMLQEALPSPPASLVERLRNPRLWPYG